MADLAPLLVSGDPLLLADLQRLAAAAGSVPVVVGDAAGALARWGVSPLVLVGDDLAEVVASARPDRRQHVHLVAREPVGTDVYRQAVQLGAESVVALPSAAGWLAELLADAEEGDAGDGLSVGIVPGAGGAGASVFGAALALELSRSGPTVLVDVDPLGAGLDRILGIERHDGIRWDALLQAAGRLSGRSLREALPRVGQLSLLAWPAQPGGSLGGAAAREAFAAARRGFAHVVLDAPRHLDAVTSDLLGRCDRLVVVTTLTVPALGAAARTVHHLPGGPTRGLVARGGRGGVPPDAAEQLLGVPLLARMADQRGLDESVDLGAGPVRSGRGPLPRAARTVADWILSGAVDPDRGAA